MIPDWFLENMKEWASIMEELAEIQWGSSEVTL